MIYPEGDAIKERIENRYTLVVLAAKRARQLKDGAPALIETTSANCLTVALEEIAAGKIDYIEGVDTRRDDESGYHDNTDPAGSLEDTFLPPVVESRPATPVISEELAAFMDTPKSSADDVEDDDDSADEAEDLESELDDDLNESTEESEA